MRAEGQCNHSGPYEREAGGLERTCDDGSRGQGDAMENLLDKEADRWSLEAGTGKEMDSLSSP